MSLSSPQFCDNCGAANRTQAQFCRVCGQSMYSEPDVSTIQRTITGMLATQAMLNQRYMIIGPAGRGGFGAVYKASDTQFGNRLVAVKEMSQSTLKPQEMTEALESFNREAMLLAGLTHPNLPRIYEQFSENGRSYLVMDFIEGETLEVRLDRLNGAKMPVEKVLDLGLQLCAVLEYLHTRQPPIIFRDLKPGNVMITPTGHIYLIDFGIARHFKPGQEKDTTALGSYGYAPPEQYGKSQTTVRADVYSLGATLHQLLSGEDPAETPFQFSYLHINDPLLAGLSALVMSMVNVEIEKRPASIALVRQELQRITSQYTMGSTLPRISANTFASTLPTASVSTLPPTPAIATRVASQPVQKATTSKKRPTKSTAQPQIYPQPNMLYVCLGHSSRITMVKWSPDGKILASASYDKTVQLWDAVSGQHLRTYKGHLGRVNDLAWSPDSKLLVSASDDRKVHIWNPANGQAVYVFDKHTDLVDAVAWSPDGKYIASGGEDHRVLVWDAQSHEVLVTYTGHTDKVLTIDWTPDGQTIASAGKDKVVRIWELDKVQQKPSFWQSLSSLFSRSGQQNWGHHEGFIHSVAWSPDAKYLASACSDYHVRVRGFPSASFPVSLPLEKSTIKNSVAWSPSGQHLAIAGNDKTVHIWSLASNKKTFSYGGHSGYVITAQWSPDGSKIASAGVDRSIQVWQAR